ncbi:MAG: acyl carrier protein [Alphaproteobacteria bacterium]|nr:acyl carrier protein [Alphaproteobacteria bacterium]
MSDISEEIRDILVFHLGCEEERLTDEARLIADLGADSLDIVEIMMSCEEKFGIDIPNLVATRLITVGDAVKCVTALVAGSAESGPMDPQPGMGLGQTP